MADSNAIPEIDVFDLPVFADANIWSMWPTEKLNELAEDIKENGFDHRYPITIAEVEGAWMLLDGRNRREAAKIAGVIPPVIVTDIDPKLAVHRSNNQNRDATPGQKAMAFAMQFPIAEQGGDRKSSFFKKLENEDMPSRPQVSKARYVLRNNPVSEGKVYPDRCLAIMAGTLTLTQAYDDTQIDVKRRAEEEAIREANAAKLLDVRNRYPDLAALVDDERITLTDAIVAAESRDREAAEQARREQEEIERKAREEEARMAEEDRIKRQLEREENDRREARKVSWFHQFNQLLSAESLVANQAQIDLADELKGTWDQFRSRYSVDFKEARRRLISLQNNLSALIEKFEAMRHE